jgi:hypothetical protein
MSDLEYDILDELYFLVHYKELKDVLGMDDEDMKPTLTKLVNKTWLRCYESPERELPVEEVDMEINFRNYFYLASKEGMKAHTN